MILIGRGLDLREGNREQALGNSGKPKHLMRNRSREAGLEENVKAKRREALVRRKEAERSGGESRSDLCGFEGAKARSCGSGSESAKPKGSQEAMIYGRLTGAGARGSKRHSHCEFPVTIA